MERLGLRERQKADRRLQILHVAKSMFEAKGYTNVTIEAIAAGANVSTVTVYNYYGSKAGLLLALVSESDERLIAQLKAMIDEKPDDLIEAVCSFGTILRRHAMDYLTKPTWREVLSSSIQEGSRDFGRTYLALDQVLIDLLESMIDEMRERGLIPDSVDSAALADCLFSIQNIRFFQFVADDDISDSKIADKLRNDLEALRAVFSPSVESR